MDFKSFYKKTKDVLLKSNASGSYDVLLNFFDTIFENDEVQTVIKYTRMSVLFEGFYQQLKFDDSLKKGLTSVRSARWSKNYGVPTIDFLLTFHRQIELTKSLMSRANEMAVSSEWPWNEFNYDNLKVDDKNIVLIDCGVILEVGIPKEREIKGRFLKTYNPSGGFAVTPCDPISQQFINFSKGNVLEIGAAFGAASIQALNNGATVFCNDITPKNLAVVKNRYMKGREITNKLENKLKLIPGTFPLELSGIPQNFFDSILICRVLHFFQGTQIDNSLSQLFENLKPGGKLFIVCETPFLKNWLKFLPEYNERVNQGKDWPGEIYNPAEYEDSGRASSLPSFVHWITKEVLERTLKKNKFNIEHLSYIDRKGQFPNDLIFDGRESVGAVAVKPY
jgi:SAM-dependent methyltransferase